MVVLHPLIVVPHVPCYTSAVTRFFLLLALLFAGGASRGAAPNIVFILCDDLGYGDVRALNPQGKIATPHADRLAAQGMIFTDAHSSSAVCTPTRRAPRPGTPMAKRLPPAQLYDLARDLGEMNNLAAAHLGIVARLTALLGATIARGPQHARPAADENGAGEDLEGSCCENRN